MKITATVIIRGTRYVLEGDGVIDGAKEVKQVIAELENSEVVINPSTVEIKH